VPALFLFFLIAESRVIVSCTRDGPPADDDFNLNSAVKEDENGAGAQKHEGF
jgi:hypothetical protein